MSYIGRQVLYLYSMADINRWLSHLHAVLRVLTPWFDQDSPGSCPRPLLITHPPPPPLRRTLVRMVHSVVPLLSHVMLSRTSWRTPCRGGTLSLTKKPRLGGAPGFHPHHRGPGGRSLEPPALQAPTAGHTQSHPAPCVATASLLRSPRGGWPAAGPSPHWEARRTHPAMGPGHWDL